MALRALVFGPGEEKLSCAYVGASHLCVLMDGELLSVLLDKLVRKLDTGERNDL